MSSRAHRAKPLWARAALAAALALLLLPAAARAAHSRARAQPPLKLTIGPGLLAAPGPTLQMQPVGLSIEYPVLAEAMGSGGCPPPALAAELQRLGEPPIQIAGASQDMTAPPGALTGQQPSWERAILYALPASFWSQLHCLLQSVDDPVTVGLNLKTGSPAWAAQMVAEARAAVTSPLSFSLGNEPDLYGIPNYASLDRPLPEEEAAVASLYIQLAGALAGSTAGAPTIGPELAISERWRAQLPRVLSALHFQTVGIHLYPLTACNTPLAVTTHGLLSQYAGDAPERDAWVVADAQAQGLPAIISEANSASCGGRVGVSDSPASAVWAARFVISALEAGFRQVRFHLSGNAYDPFLVRGAEIVRRPMEAVMVALNQWLPLGSSVHPVPVPRSRNVIATALSGSGGALTLLLDNRGAHPQRVQLRSTGALTEQIISDTLGLTAAAPLPLRAGAVSLSLPAQSILVLGEH